jgi:hypothetical protein
MIRDSDAYIVYNAAVSLLIDKVMDGKSTSLCNCLTTIFTADNRNRVRWAKLFGILSLEFDRRLKSTFFKY